jgi:HK97 family phage prohead protease
MEPKYFFANVKSIDLENRTLDVIASTPELDRDGEIILPSAFSETIESFKANPVILAGHQHRLSSGSSPVIGSAIPESIEIGDKAVSFRMKFATTPLGEEYWNLYSNKHMRAFSVGFIPLVGEMRTVKGKSVYHHTKAELLETSGVPVPSNRGALARAKGYFDAEETKDTIAAAVKEQFAEFRKLIEQQLEDIKAMIIANSGGLAERELGSGFELPEPGGEEQKMAEEILKTCQEITTR